jgi:hypothetical protein
MRWKSGWRLTLPPRTRPFEIWKGGVEFTAPVQNLVELAALVSATRTSAVLAAEAESRCAKELATLKAL